MREFPFLITLKYVLLRCVSFEVVWKLQFFRRFEEALVLLVDVKKTTDLSKLNSFEETDSKRSFLLNMYASRQ